MNTSVENRLRRLERTNRLALAFALTLGLVLLLGSNSESDRPTSVRSQRIELVDAQGSVRAYLGTDEDGATGLFIRDPKGSLRLSLAHGSSQSALFVHDAEGTVRIGVAQFAHGGGGVALHGAKSKGGAVLYHKESGSLSFFDEDGETTTRIP
jgi:hypothetical protein